MIVPYAKLIYDLIGILSRAGPVKPCLKLAAPSAKAKYSWETDSEQVPWGKGEKYSEQESEIEPETVRLQAVGANLLVTACLLHNEPTSYSSLARLSIFEVRSRSESESE